MTRSMAAGLARDGIRVNTLCPGFVATESQMAWLSPLEHIRGMKLKTSVTLSEDVIKRLDRATRKGENRSQAIERLLRERLETAARKAADPRDLSLIDENAAELNAEAEDVLAYQTKL